MTVLSREALCFPRRHEWRLEEVRSPPVSWQKSCSLAPPGVGCHCKFCRIQNLFTTCRSILQCQLAQCSQPITHSCMFRAAPRVPSLHNRHKETKNTSFQRSLPPCLLCLIAAYARLSSAPAARFPRRVLTAAHSCAASHHQPRPSHKSIAFCSCSNPIPAADRDEMTLDV